MCDFYHFWVKKKTEIVYQKQRNSIQNCNFRRVMIFLIWAKIQDGGHIVKIFPKY